MIATISASHHRMRRKVLHNYFSQKSVSEAEPLILEKIHKAIQLLNEARNKSDVVNLSLLFTALTTDVISHFAYGMDFQALDSNGLDGELRDAILAATSMGHFLHFLPFNVSHLSNLPLWLVRAISPNVATIMSVKKRIHQQVIEALDQKKLFQNGKPSMFSALQNPRLPASERSIHRLQDEGLIILAAGSETTSTA